MTDIDLLLTEIDHLKSWLLRERQISGAAREHHLRNLKIKDAEIGRLRKRASGASAQIGFSPRSFATRKRAVSV